jgi:hypothetical protein
MAATLPWPSHLAHEAAAWAKRPRHARDDELGLQHPMQRGVGEHGVEGAVIGQRVPVRALDSEAARARRSQEVFAQIDAQHVGGGGRDLGGEHAMAAAEIENALAFPRVEHGEHVAGEIGDETPIAGIVVGGPALHRHGD